MNILRVYANFQTELQYAEHYIAEELYKEGHKTTFITSDKYYRSWKRYLSEIKPAGYYSYNYYDVYRLSSLRLIGKVIFPNLGKLKNVIKNTEADVIHLYGISSYTTITVLWLCYFNIFDNTPIIVSDHSSPSREKKGIMAYLYYGFFKMHMRLLKDTIDKYITVNSASNKFLSRKYRIPQKDIEVIPLGYNTYTFHYDYKLKNNNQKMILGFAGKIDPKKRIDFLITCLESSDLVDRIKLIIVGFDRSSEYSQSLLLHARQSKLSIEFRPLANKIELAKFYNYIDVAVFPGSLSITTVEANGCGTPTILYEFIEGLEYRVENGRGRLFSNKEELLESVRFYYQKYYEDGIDNAGIEASTKKKYSWEIIKEKYLDIYEKAIHERSSKSVG